MLRIVKDPQCPVCEIDARENVASQMRRTIEGDEIYFVFCGLCGHVYGAQAVAGIDRGYMSENLEQLQKDISRSNPLGPNFKA